jgi:hemerythrin
MISKLIKQNPYSFSIEYNKHKKYYQNVIEAITDIEQGDLSEIEPKVLQKIKETDTWIWIRMYYVSAGGFTDIHHYNIHKAIQQAIKEMKRIKQKQG